MPIKIVDTTALKKSNIQLTKELQVQKTILPTASAEEEGHIYQYVGTTTASYTNGYSYKCVPDTTPGTYKWERVNVQPGGGGSSVQSDWNQSDSSADDYIKNKPDLSKKQDKLEEGANISIVYDSEGNGNPVISSTGGVSRLNKLDYKGYGKKVLRIEAKYINAVKTHSALSNGTLYMDGVNILKPEDSTKTSYGITVEPDESFYGYYHIYGTATNNICISVGKCVCSSPIRTNSTNPDGLYFGVSYLTGDYDSAWFQLQATYNASNRKAYVGEGERFHTDAASGNSTLYIAFTKNKTYDFYIMPVCFPISYIENYSGRYVSPLSFTASTNMIRLGGFWGIMPFEGGVILSTNNEISEVYVPNNYINMNIEIDAEIALIHGQSLSVHKAQGNITPSNHICSITIPSILNYQFNVQSILFQYSTSTISDPYSYSSYQYVIPNLIVEEMPTASDPDPRITADDYSNTTISWYTALTTAINYCYELSFADISL